MTRPQNQINMKEREEDSKYKQMTRSVKINPYIFAGLPVEDQADIVNSNSEANSGALLRVTRAVYAVTGKNLSAIKKKSRSYRDGTMDARHLFNYFAWKETGNYSQVARYLGIKSHATVINSVKQIQGFIDVQDRYMMPQIEQVNNYLAEQ